VGLVVRGPSSGILMLWAFSPSPLVLGSWAAPRRAGPVLPSTCSPPPPVARRPLGLTLPPRSHLKCSLWPHAGPGGLVHPRGAPLPLRLWGPAAAAWVGGSCASVGRRGSPAGARRSPWWFHFPGACCCGRVHCLRWGPVEGFLVCGRRGGGGGDGCGPGFGFGFGLVWSGLLVPGLLSCCRPVALVAGRFGWCLCSSCWVPRDPPFGPLPGASCARVRIVWPPFVLLGPGVVLSVGLFAVLCCVCRVACCTLDSAPGFLGAYLVLSYWASRGVDFRGVVSVVWWMCIPWCLLPSPLL